MTRASHLELLIATSNNGKVREIKQALHGLPLNLRVLNNFPNLRVVEEIGETYEQNAKLKAIEYSKQTGLHTLADDSGLEVELLGGRPGIRSARLGGAERSDSSRTDKLLSALAEFQTSNRSARFVSCIAVAGPVNTSVIEPEVLIVETGHCLGTIADRPRGLNGFGYDSVFIPQGYNETFGELSEQVKQRISHRAKALAEIRIFIERYIGNA